MNQTSERGLPLCWWLCARVKTGSEQNAEGRQTVLSRVPTVCAVRGPCTWMVESTFMRGVGGDANREQSHPQRREQCIRQQSRRSSALA